MQLQDVPRHAQHVHLARESLNAADARVAAFFQLLGMVVIEHLCLLEQVVGHARKRADNGGGAGKGSDDAGLAGVTGGAAADDFEVWNMVPDLSACFSSPAATCLPTVLQATSNYAVRCSDGRTTCIVVVNDCNNVEFALISQRTNPL
jgi:hypothetical protein